MPVKVAGVIVGKLQASHSDISRAVPAALILLKTRSSAASSSIHHRKKNIPQLRLLKMREVSRHQIFRQRK